MKKKNTETLILGTFYHVYNRGTNGQDVFMEEENYTFFLNRLAKYVYPVARIYAYALLNNHFHLLIQTRSGEELAQIVANYLKIRDIEFNSESEAQILQYLSAQISHFFNSYSQSFNKRYHRSGSLWEHPYRRKAITDERYFAQLIYYIHNNPVKHGFTTDILSYRHSSYQTFLTNKPTKLERDAVLDWFGGLAAFKTFHASDATDLEDDYQLE